MKTNLNKIVPQIVMAVAVVGAVAAPSMASAFDRNDYRHHSDDKSSWQGLSIVGGLVGAAGLLAHDKTVAAIGLGTGLYAAIRADQGHSCIEARYERHDVRFDYRDRRDDWRREEYRREEYRREDRRRDLRDDRREDRRDRR